MIKATDLMIGDWVNIQSEKDDEPMYSQVEQLWEYEIDADFQTGYENVHPIELTKEILEKNGFKEDFETNGIYWRSDCRKFCIVKELDTWYFAFRVLGETVDKSPGYICISECNYVHKLQHILKDLEIEMEIVL